MWPDRVSNPGPLTYESGALPTALRGPANNPRSSGDGYIYIKHMGVGVFEIQFNTKKSNTPPPSPPPHPHTPTPLLMHLQLYSFRVTKNNTNK